MIPNCIDININIYINQSILYFIQINLCLYSKDYYNYKNTLTIIFVIYSKVIYIYI